MKTVTFVTCALHALLTHASYLRIHHRIFDPAKPSPPFSLRADIQLSPEREHTFLAPQSGINLALGSDYPENILYQVALERDGGPESHWDLSSVKACHLYNANADIINVHIGLSDKDPYAVDFYLYPVPHDGSCPNVEFVPKEITFLNTTINFKLASSVPSPIFRVPPPLSPDGEPIQHEPEKSFLQKYWMYIAMGLLTFAIAGGPPPEEEQANGQGRTGGARTDGR